jgi:hypothetical protein
MFFINPYSPLIDIVVVIGEEKRSARERALRVRRRHSRCAAVVGPVDNKLDPQRRRLAAASLAAKERRTELVRVVLAFQPFSTNVPLLAGGPSLHQHN